MRLSSFVITTLIFLTALVFSALMAGLSAYLIETRTEAAVAQQLYDDGYEWAEVEVDGLQVQLIGEAPTEAARFRALSSARAIVDASRVRDSMIVEAAARISAPRFSIEILRNDEGMSVIGLIPKSSDREVVMESIAQTAGALTVTDLLEVADFPAPEGFDIAMFFALEALNDLPRSKISIAADQITITAITSSLTEKRALENSLARRAPSSVQLALDIAAPRPVIAPFTLRFVLDDAGARFDACSADTLKSRDTILTAAQKAGFDGDALCTIGMGVPTTKWGDGVQTAIEALQRLKAGSITFSNVDVSLVAAEGTEKALFDSVVGELEADLPSIFSLTTVLPAAINIDGTGENEDGPPEFVATKSPEGDVQLRGVLPNERQRDAATSFAKARFGASDVYAATRLDDALPKGWSQRTLTGLTALAMLENGALVVQPDFIDLRGTTGSTETNADIARLFSTRLGETAHFQLNITYDKKLDPTLALPTAAECIERANGVLVATKITFAPGSGDIDAGSQSVIDDLADALKGCDPVPILIAGYTDSQGREEMNQNLSQARADAVLNALQARRVITENLTSRGYGEASPIGDNETEEGREANRRIEFSLLADSDSAAEAGAEE